MGNSKIMKILIRGEGGGGYSTYNLNVCLNFVLSFLHTPKNGGGVQLYDNLLFNL